MSMRDRPSSCLIGISPHFVSPRRSEIHARTSGKQAGILVGQWPGGFLGKRKKLMALRGRADD